MNKYADIYFGHLKAAQDGLLAKVIPNFDELMTMVADYRKERREARGLGATMDSTKSIPQVSASAITQGTSAN